MSSPGRRRRPSPSGRPASSKTRSIWEYSTPRRSPFAWVMARRSRRRVTAGGSWAKADGLDFDAAGARVEDGGGDLVEVAPPPEFFVVCEVGEVRAGIRRCAGSSRGRVAGGARRGCGCGRSGGRGCWSLRDRG